MSYERHPFTLARSRELDHHAPVGKAIENSRAVAAVNACAVEVCCNDESLRTVRVVLREESTATIEDIPVDIADGLRSEIVDEDGHIEEVICR